MRKLQLSLTISILFTILTSLSCTRQNTGPAKVTFRLPPKSTFQKNISAQSVSQIADFDCLGVLVSAPGDTANTCTLKNGTSFTAGSPHGPYAFLNSSSQDISLSLPPGDSRVIRVIGFATSTGACLDFGDDVDDPHVVAESASLTLQAGKTQTLELTMALDSGKAMEDCKGTDFNGDGGGSDGPYLRVEGLYNYEMGENASAKPLTRGVCYPVSFMPYQPCNGGVCTPKTPTTDLVVTLANNDVKFYSSAVGCENASVEMTSITLTGGVSPGTQGSPLYTGFMRIPLSKTNVVTTDLENEVSVPAGSEIEFTQPQHSYFNVGKPVVRSSGLVPNASNYFSAAQLPLSGCTATDTTIHFYPAGSTAPDWVVGNELTSHETFTGITSGLHFRNICAGASVFASPTQGSITGRFEQNSSLGTTGGDVNKGLRLNIGAHAGKWIVAGGFGSFAGDPSGPIKRLFHSGQNDVTFKPPTFDGQIHDVVEQSDGSLIVAGDFTTVASLPRRGLARLYSDGTLDQTFNLELGDGFAKTLALNGTTVFVGGTFTSIGGSPRSHLAAFSYATQIVSSWAPDANNLVTDIEAQPSENALFVGGYFTTIAGQSRSYLASFALDTLGLTTWDPSPAGFVFSLNSSLPTYTLLVGGNFTSIEGNSRNQVAAYTGGTSSPTLASFDVTGQSFAGPVFSILRSSSFIYIGGLLDAGGYGSLIRVPLAGGAADSNFQKAVNNTVKSMAYDVGDLLIFGSFTSVNGDVVNGYAAVDIGGGLPYPRSTSVMNSRRSVFTFNPDHFDAPPFLTFGH